ncbi:MAG: BNR-4 repeat-containing protein [Breznakibacter sp.]
MSLPGGSDGNLSHIDVSGLGLTTLPYSIEMWVKPNGTQTDNAGLFYHRGTGNAGIQYASSWQGSGKIRFMSNAGSNDYGTESSIVVTPDEWHHVAVVLTSTSSIMYLDGEVYSRNVSSPVYDFSAGKLYIGWDNGLANRAFKGLVDEVRVWNTTRTEQEIAANRFQTIPGDTPGLIAYWNFDDRDFSKVTDATGHGYDGIIKGGSYVLSSVFDSMVYKNATMSQTSKQVNSPAANVEVARLDIKVENHKDPLSLTALQLSLNGTTSMTDIADVNVYYTGKTATFSTAARIAGLGTAPTGSSITLPCNQTLVAGTNYVWITYDVAGNAPKGNLLDVECTSIELAGDITNSHTPTTTAPEGALTVNPDIFIGNVLISTDVATSTAYTTANGANFVSFQQNAVMTYKGYQYVSYWSNAKRVCIARKKMPNGNWEPIEFADYTTSHDLGDNHYNISFGICENDGTIHLAFDHHNDALNYRVSIPGLANNPELSWTAASFGAKRDYLVTGVTVKDNASLSGNADIYDGGITYPRFVSKPDGNLLFECRTGWSGDGNSLLWEYNGTWAFVGEYMHGRFGSSSGYTSKCGYINGLHYTPGGSRLHASLVWRETPTASTNHEVYYAYSDNHGRTWYNTAGQLIADVSAANPLHYDDAGFKVYSVGETRGLINQESQAVDSKGKIHILQSYMLDSEPNSSDWAGSRAKSYLRHIYQDGNGTWQSDVIALSLTDRSDIAVDEGDNLYVVAPGYRVYFAGAKDNWQTWTEFDLSANGTATAEGLIDREALLNESVLSFVFAHKSHSTTAGKIIVPYYLIDKSKPGTGTGLNVSVYDGTEFNSLLTQNLNAVNITPLDISHSGEAVGIRCQGTIETEYAEAYTLYFTTSGSARVWINDQLVLATGTVTSETSFPIVLNLQPSHKYTVKVEGQYTTSSVVAKLEWESARQIRQLVPATALYGTLADIPNSVVTPNTIHLTVQYHPNPFDVQTQIRVNGPFSYQLFDINGTTMEQGRALDQLTLGQTLAKGVYLLMITQGNFNQTVKLVKL